MSPALLIVDLQNDFVSPDGALKKKIPHHLPLEPLLTNLKPVCKIFQDQKWPIIAIKSEYPNDNNPLNPSDDYLSGTHQGKSKVCVPGSHGADFHPDAQALFEEVGAMIITKRMYSAFEDTELDSYLQSQNIGSGPLYFAGVTANNCVLASLRSGFELGYNVFAIQDCIGATSENLKSSALRTIETYYGDIISSSELTLSSTQEEIQKPHRILYWVSGSIPSWRVMLALSLKGLPYTAKRLHVMTVPKDTRRAEFLAINPRGKTPTLIDEDGTIMIESMAILQYLETYYPIPSLTPPADQKEEFEHQLLRFHETENLHNVFEDIELLFLPDWSTAHYKSRIFSAYTNTLHELKFWDAYLGKTNFIASDEFTLADCAFYPNIAYLVHRGLDLMKEGYVNLERYMQIVAGMKCAKEACPVGWERRGKKNLFSKANEIAQ